MAEKKEATTEAVVSQPQPSVEPAKKPKKKIWGCLIFIVIIVFIFSLRTFGAFFGGFGHKDSAVPNLPDIANQNTNETVNNNQNSTVSTSTNSKQSNRNTSTSTPSSSTVPVPAQPVSTFDPLELFVEMATTYQTKSGTSKRWIKNPVYIGGKESDFSSLYSECLNQVIEGFNSASTEVSLVRNAELADIKIYWVTQEELSNIYNTDSGRPYATWSVDNGRIYASTIMMPIDSTDVDDLKCYTMKHEVMHAIGFAHTDQTSYTLMAMPTVGKNITTGLTDVDKRAIRMLYSLGLPLKQSADQIRQYFASHAY